MFNRGAPSKFAAQYAGPAAPRVPSGRFAHTAATRISTGVTSRLSQMDIACSKACRAWAGNPKYSTVMVADLVRPLPAARRNSAGGGMCVPETDPVPALHITGGFTGALRKTV